MRIDLAQAEGVISGFGVPTGGTANQVLAKINGDNYNTAWVNSGGGGGNSGIYYNAGTTTTNNTIDWSNGLTQEILVDNNPTLSFINGVSGETQSLVFKQTESGDPLVSWPGNVTWSQSLGGKIPTLKPFGSLDTEFNAGGTGFNNTPRDTVQKSNGNLLIGGDFTIYNGSGSNYFIEITQAGTIVTTFSNNFNENVTTIQLQEDGKIILGGNFTSYSGTNINRIIRLNSDYSYDSSFNVGTGFDGQVWSSVVLPDGSIVFVGDFNTYNGVSVGKIAKLNSSGVLDTTFNTNIGSGFSTFGVNTIKITSDGKLLIGGNFVNFNGVSTARIVKLDFNGLRDNTFNIGTGFNSAVSVIEEDGNGQLFIGGFFTQYNGVNRNGLVKLNSGGTIDNTFNIGVGFQTSTDVRTINILDDGKILVCGGFVFFNNIRADRFVVLNSNGSFNFTLNPPLVTSVNTVFETFPLNKTMLIMGNFTGYNGNTNGIISVNIVSEQYTQFNFLYTGEKYIGSIPSYDPSIVEIPNIIRESLTITSSGAAPSLSNVSRNIITLTDEGNGWANVFFTLQKASGGNNGSGSYMISLPGGYEWDYTYYTASNIGTNISILFYSRSLSFYGATITRTSLGEWNLLGIYPTEFPNRFSLFATEGNRTGGYWSSSLYPISGDLNLSGQFRFKYKQ